MGAPFVKTKYPGVYTRVLNRRIDGQQERAYIVWYKDAEGKPHYKTIGTHYGDGMRPQTANAVRDEIIREIREGAKRSSPEPAPDYTVGDAVEAYSVYARGEGKYIDRDMSAYNTSLRSALHAVPITAVVPAILSRVKIAMRDSGLSDQSIVHRFAFLRRAINYAIDGRLYVGPNPLSTRRNGQFKLPEPQNARVRYLDPDQATALLAAMKRRSQSMYVMGELSLRTGMRITEIFGIVGADVDRASGIIFVTAKGGKRQPVHASPAVFDLIAPYVRGPQHLLFPARTGARRKGIGNAFPRAVDDVGLNRGVTDSIHKVTFHTFRHTFASWLAQSGKVTMLELKELMRHESIRMTLRYAHLIPGHQANSLSIVSDLLDHALPPRP